MDPVDALRRRQRHREEELPMKIVKYRDFLKLRAGTLYSTFAPYHFGPLSIKGETIKRGAKGIDFFAVEGLAGSIKHDNTEQFIENCNAAMRGESVKMDFETEQREGLYEREQLYAVFEDEDMLAFVDRIMDCYLGLNPKTGKLIDDEEGEDECQEQPSLPVESGSGSPSESSPEPFSSS